MSATSEAFCARIIAILSRRGMTRQPSQGPCRGCLAIPQSASRSGAGTASGSSPLIRRFLAWMTADERGPDTAFARVATVPQRMARGWAARQRVAGGVGAIVIQFIVSGALPRSPMLRSRCLANPDRLLEITRAPDQVSGSGEAKSDPFSLILHDLRMGGAWKRTNRGRLRQTEQMLCGHIAPELRAELTLLDIGASDGITTVEAIRALRRAFG